jgi:hypothetical protein
MAHCRARPGSATCDSEGMQEVTELVSDMSTPQARRWSHLNRTVRVHLAPALGATVTEAPTISGDRAAIPGSDLIASTEAWTSASVTAAYDWLRCSDSGGSCVPISGACGRRYTGRTGDIGYTLSARVTVTDSAGQRRGQLCADRRRAAPANSLHDEGRRERYLHPREYDGARPGHVHLRRADRRRHNHAADYVTALHRPFPIVRIARRFVPSVRSSRASCSTRHAARASAWRAEAAVAPTGARRSL